MDTPIVYRKPELTKLPAVFGSLAEARNAALEARVAELEKALDDIRDDIECYLDKTLPEKRTLRTIDAVLPRPPEGDMCITQEEWDA